MIALRKVPVHAWVQITREKIRVLGREPNSETDFVDSEYVVTFCWKQHASQNQSSGLRRLLGSEGHLSI